MEGWVAMGCNGLDKSFLARDGMGWDGISCCKWMDEV